MSIAIWNFNCLFLNALLLTNIQLYIKNNITLSLGNNNKMAGVKFILAFYMILLVV